MRILLTRPLTELGSTRRRLQRMGLDVVMVPVIEIQPVDEETRRQDLARLLADATPQIILCISRNAALWGVPLLLEQWPQAREAARWYSLGDATAEVLRGFGLAVEVPEHGSDSESLLALPSLQGLSGCQVLYLAGEAGRQLIETEMRERGAEVHRWAVYRRRPDPGADAQLAALDQAPDVVAAMSGESLVALVRALPLEHLRAWQRVRLIVPSERVAAMAREQGFQHVDVAPVMGSDWPADYLAGQAAL